MKAVLDSVNSSLFQVKREREQVLDKVKYRMKSIEGELKDLRANLSTLDDVEKRQSELQEFINENKIENKEKDIREGW